MKLMRRFWLSLLMSLGIAYAGAAGATDYTSTLSVAGSREEESAEEGECFETRFGTAQVVTRAALICDTVWQDSYGRYCKDDRYYQVCETALKQDNFDYRYLLLKDSAGRVQALQPFFFTDQDLTAGLSASLRGWVSAVRGTFPNFLSMKMLMVGCTAGEGQLGMPEGGAPESVPALLEALRIYGRKEKAAIITFKDFPSEHRAVLDASAKSGYVRMPSFPATILKLDGFADAEDYIARKLGKSMRKNLRRKFRKESEAGLTMEVTNDVSACIDELHPLYLQVLARSNFRFEELTREYFVMLGRTMPERARFFIWRQNGKAVAFSACMVHDGKLYDNYLGLDYAVALDLHLYFVTIRDLIGWGIKQKLQYYYSTPLNYDAKLHLRFDLAPLDLYVRHLSDWVNPFFRRIAPLLEPTRYDKLLPQFDNHADLV
jgi:hypothetical protein